MTRRPEQGGNMAAAEEPSRGDREDGEEEEEEEEEAVSAVRKAARRQRRWWRAGCVWGKGRGRGGRQVPHGGWRGEVEALPVGHVACGLSVTAGRPKAGSSPWGSAAPFVKSLLPRAP